LLVVPATGEQREEPTRRKPGRGHLLKLTTALGCFGLVGAFWWAGSQATEQTRSGSTVLPASAVSKRVRWIDYGAGLERARVEGKPMLVTFVTDWCPYCGKMNRNTWHSPSVVERLDDLIPVRVDAEDELVRNGYSGIELAGRYNVQGYPANFLLDSEGRLVSRRDGYLAPRQLLEWIDSTVGRQPGSGSSATSQSVSR
jgi:thiol:disulfide interchange protein